jgi:hypothetical protein
MAADFEQTRAMQVLPVPGRTAVGSDESGRKRTENRLPFSFPYF